MATGQHHYQFVKVSSVYSYRHILYSYVAMNRDIHFMCFAEIRPCRIDGQSIFPYEQTGPQISYLLQDICEHTVLATCDDSKIFSVNVDFSEESLNLARVGVQYNETIIIVVIGDNVLTVNAQNLDTPIS